MKIDGLIEIKGRIMYINMDAIKIPKTLGANLAMAKRRRESRRLDPFSFSDPIKKRIYETPEQLQAAIDSYFQSCQGKRYYKGKPVLDEDGKPVIGQIEPYTVTGLARHIGISVRALSSYQSYVKSGLVPPEFADIINDAKLRIQEYAERRLYDREGAGGARFVLEASFGWMTKKENMELQQTDQRIQLTRDKLEFVKKQAEEDKLQDKELVVNILRASDEDP